MMSELVFVSSEMTDLSADKSKGLVDLASGGVDLLGSS